MSDGRSGDRPAAPGCRCPAGASCRARTGCTQPRGPAAARRRPTGLPRSASATARSTGRQGDRARGLHRRHPPAAHARRLLRCPHPHARIVRIDATGALAQPGVIAVITGKDMPERFGIIPWTPDEYPLARTRRASSATRSPPWPRPTSGPPTRRRSSIDVEYEILPAATDLDDALEQPEVGLGESGKDNVSKEVELAFGDVDGLLAALRRRGRGRVLLRGLGARAHRDALRDRRSSTPTGLLTVWSATQVAALPAPRALARARASRRRASASSSRPSAAPSAARASRSRSSSAPPSSP